MNALVGTSRYKYLYTHLENLPCPPFLLDIFRDLIRDQEGYSKAELSKHTLLTT